MTAFTQYGSGTSPSVGNWKHPWVEQYFLDFTVSPAGSSSDTYKLIYIPAGTTVLNVTANVVTACTTSFTFELGDSGSATRYFNTGTATSSTGLIAPNTYTAHTYTAADYILLTCQAATAIVGQLAFTVVFADMNYRAATAAPTL
jgi:hypothetical protein